MSNILGEINSKGIQYKGVCLRLHPPATSICIVSIDCLKKGSHSTVWVENECLNSNFVYTELIARLSSTIGGRVYLFTIAKISLWEKRIDRRRQSWLIDGHIQDAKSVVNSVSRLIDSARLTFSPLPPTKTHFQNQLCWSDFGSFAKFWWNGSSHHCRSLRFYLCIPMHNSLLVSALWQAPARNEVDLILLDCQLWRLLLEQQQTRRGDDRLIIVDWISVN